MWKHHGQCVPPPNPDAWIWRYMSFAKFVDMLERQKLYFSRLDQLGDPFEGSFSEATAEGLKQWLEEHGGNLTDQGEEIHKNLIIDTYRINSICAYVSCWHMNVYESAAMWPVYGREGIAKRSTYRLLCQSLESEKQDVNVGIVYYRDHLITPDFAGNTLHPVLRKRKSFEHEHELRAIVLQIPPRWKGGRFPYGRYVNRKPKGIPIKCDLNRLIENVYVAPQSRDWIKELVAKVMKTYKLEKPLETSDLEKRPDLR